MSGRDGKNPLGGYAEKAAERVVDSQPFQDAMKQQAKQ